MKKIKKRNKKNKVKPFTNLALPLIRRTFPSLFANNIVSIQPMSGPSGLAFAMKHLYSDDEELFTFSDYGDDYGLYTWDEYDEEE